MIQGDSGALAEAPISFASPSSDAAVNRGAPGPVICGVEGMHGHLCIAGLSMDIVDFLVSSLRASSHCAYE